MPIYSTNDAQVNRVLAYFHRNLHQSISFKELASALCTTPDTLTRHFIKATGMNPSEWIKLERLKRSKKLLLENQLSLLKIAHHVGYRSTKTFIKQFQEQEGMHPQEWQKRNQQDEP